MTEQEANDKLEELCGSIPSAFKLTYLWRESRQIVSGDRYRLGKRERDVTEVFIPKAKEAGYSSAAINHYINWIA